MEEFLLIHDYQHGSFGYRVLAKSKDEVAKKLSGQFEIWENFRNDRLLMARFGITSGKQCWEDFPEKSLKELSRNFGNM